MPKVLFNLLINLLMIIITGYILALSYNNLIGNIKKNYNNQAKDYISQNQAIDNILSIHSKNVTKNDVVIYDEKNNTDLIGAIGRIQSSQMLAASCSLIEQKNQPPQNEINSLLDSIKCKNASKVIEIEQKERGFWSYLPPMPVLIFGGIGIFFTALITNMSNSFYEATKNFLNWSYNKIKKIF